MNTLTSPVGMQNAAALWETAWKFLIKLNIHLPYELAISLLDIYPRDIKTRSQKNLYANVYSGFTAEHQKLKTAQYPSAAGQTDSGMAI